MLGLTCGKYLNPTTLFQLVQCREGLDLVHHLEKIIRGMDVGIRIAHVSGIGPGGQDGTIV